MIFSFECAAFDANGHAGDQNVPRKRCTDRWSRVNSFLRSRAGKSCV